MLSKPFSQFYVGVPEMFEVELKGLQVVDAHGLELAEVDGLAFDLEADNKVDEMAFDVSLDGV